MKSVKSIVAIIGIIVKYGAIVTAILKGIQVVSDELSKLDLGKEEPKNQPLKITENE
jgi:hypothetical protein